MVAITGASGSGKSTLAQSLVQFAQAKADGPRTCLLSLDAYYRDLSHLSIPEREAVNFDRLEAIELPLFSDHLARLRLGERVAVPRYDFSQHTRVAGQTAQMGPCRAGRRRWLAVGCLDRLGGGCRLHRICRDPCGSLLTATTAKRLRRAG